ncbi:MAG TPA: hemerythrin domain-containing protein, partial [Candidatus Nitrosotenuis sp.]|nr:hemerythrin domain-containing protein [Candidatus Nitrosotenuis sp.]
MAQRCTNHLMDEHREAETVLNDLERFVHDVASGEAWSAAQRAEFERIIAIITRLMRSHIHKEHHILFPALEKYLPPDEGPLDVLRNEHVSIEALSRRLTIIAGRAAEAAGPSASKDFVRAGKEFLRSC